MMSDSFEKLLPQVSSTSSSKTQSHWQSILDRQSHSGMTIKAFCQKHGVSISCFYMWRKRLGQGFACSKRTERAKDFVRVEVDRSGCNQVELSFPNGVTARFSSIDLNQLMKLMLPGDASC